MYNTPPRLRKIGSGSDRIQKLHGFSMRVSAKRILSDALFTATHSMMSVYFGCMTMVLKFPLTNAASTNGLHRYKGFATAG